MVYFADLNHWSHYCRKWRAGANGSRIEDRGSRIEDRGSKIEDRPITDPRSSILDPLPLYSPTYLPMIAASFFLVSAGTAAGCVRIAWRSAAPHLQARGVAARRRTASRMITCALAEFLFRYSMIISTVTASWSGCQQS